MKEIFSLHVDVERGTGAPRVQREGWRMPLRSCERRCAGRASGRAIEIIARLVPNDAGEKPLAYVCLAEAPATVRDGSVCGICLSGRPFQSAKSRSGSLKPVLVCGLIEPLLFPIPSWATTARATSARSSLRIHHPSRIVRRAGATVAQPARLIGRRPRGGDKALALATPSPPGLETDKGDGGFAALR